MLENMNTRAKGRRNEFRCRDALVALGYVVELSRPASRFSVQNDLWGLWDVVGVRHDGIRFIQVKTNHTATKDWRRRAIEWHVPNNATKELWIYYDRVKEPKIVVL